MRKLAGKDSTIPHNQITPEIAYKQNISWIVCNREKLIKRYDGMYVLVRNKKVIDSSKDRFELDRRLSKKHSPELITMYSIWEEREERSKT